jgi:hypothetical protein
MATQGCCGGFFSDAWNTSKSSFTGFFKNAYNAVTNPGTTVSNAVSSFKKMSVGEMIATPVRISPAYQMVHAEVSAVKAIFNGDGKALGNVIGPQVANTLTVAATEGVGSALGKGMSALRGVNNPVPSTLARAVPTADVSATLAPPWATDAFVTGASDLHGLSSSEIANKLTIPQSSSGFTIFEFPTPEGISTPINRTNPGFVGFGRTAGGAREFVVPNGPIPSNATTRTVIP